MSHKHGPLSGGSAHRLPVNKAARLARLSSKEGKSGGVGAGEGPCRRILFFKLFWSETLNRFLNFVIWSEIRYDFTVWSKIECALR